MTEKNYSTTINNLLDDWATLVVARMCIAANLSSQQIQDSINQLASQFPLLSEILKDGYFIFSIYPASDINMMSNIDEQTIMGFHNVPNFHYLFNKLMNITDSLMGVPFGPQVATKTKALHTDKIVQEEVLTDLEKLRCHLFTYLASLVEAAAVVPDLSFDQINLDIVNIIFKYLKYDQPNAVRAAAGTILSALSLSARHTEMICDIFWDQFLALKKDIDFRNFASWIDGIMNLQFSLSPQLRQTSLTFLTNFLSNSQKIERGVLRMKFLDALYSMLKKLNSSPDSSEDQEYNKLLSEIYEVPLKWSTKSKHTAFCCAFLQKILALPNDTFYLSHGVSFMQVLVKYTKGGEPEFLQIIVDFIKNSPKSFYQKRTEEFTKMISDILFPLLFNGKEAKRTPRFTNPQQIDLIISILVEIGIKQILPIVDLARSLMSIEKGNEDVKRSRNIIIRTFSKLSVIVPPSVAHYNVQLFPLFEPIFIQKIPEEIGFVIQTFPLIHSQNKERVAMVTDVLFELGRFCLTYLLQPKEITPDKDGKIENPILSEKELVENKQIALTAFHSLDECIEELVTLEENSKLPFNYLNKLLEPLKTAPIEFRDKSFNEICLDILTLEARITEMIISLSKFVQKIDLEELKSGKFELKVDDWNQS